LHAVRVTAADVGGVACRDFYKPSDAMTFARSALKIGQSPQAVADALVERALKRYTADNVSVCVLKFPWAFKGGQGKSAGSKP
jgi:hypothetical protein